ncbi:hypothetical protein ACFW2Y_09065 [Streptomyces sp. NPDC058877]
MIGILPDLQRLHQIRGDSIIDEETREGLAVLDQALYAADGYTD